MKLSEKKQLFEESYPQLVDKLYRYVYLRVQHQHDCEDLVSEIFLDAYKQLDRYNEDKGVFEQWLIGIARFKIIDYWKSRRITLEIEEAILLIDGLYSETMDRQIDTQIMLEQVLQKLPQDIQVMFTLRYIDDLTYEQIAAITNKTPDTVRKLFSRLHQKLRLEFPHSLELTPTTLT